MNSLFRFQNDQQEEQVAVQWSGADLDSYRLAPKSFQYTGLRPPKDWETTYFNMFTGHRGFEDAARQLTGWAMQQSSERDAQAMLLIRFVQGAISYDWQTFHRIQESKIRYPLETLAAGTGVCADKSILLADLLQRLGYDLVWFVFDRANHMGVGIRVPEGMGNFGSPYAFVESTAYTPIGTVPEKYVGQVRLDRKPRTIPVNGGGNAVFHKIVALREESEALSDRYGKEYLSYSPRQQDLHRQMEAIKQQMDSLDAEIKQNGCKGRVPSHLFQKCQALIGQRNGLVGQYNQLVQEFNASNG